MATSSAPTGDGTVPKDHPPQDGALASGSPLAETAGREQEEEEEAEEEEEEEEEEEDEEEASDEDDAAFDASLAHAGIVSLTLYFPCASNARPPAMMRWLRCNDVALRCAAIKPSSIEPVPVPRTLHPPLPAAPAARPPVATRSLLAWRCRPRVLSICTGCLNKMLCCSTGVCVSERLM